MSIILEKAARRVVDGELWLPTLSRRCPNCEPDGIVLPKLCDAKWEPGCHGTGRVMNLTSDNIDAAMERLGAASGRWACVETGGYIYAYEWIAWCQGEGVKIDEARIAAAEVVVKSEWPEVEND
jgi:hypothetical protein